MVLSDLELIRGKYADLAFFVTVHKMFYNICISVTHNHGIRLERNDVTDRILIVLLIHGDRDLGKTNNIIMHCWDVWRAPIICRNASMIIDKMKQEYSTNSYESDKMHGTPDTILYI